MTLALIGLLVVMCSVYRVNTLWTTTFKPLKRSAFSQSHARIVEIHASISAR
jgi:hypothetical protein